MRGIHGLVALAQELSAFPRGQVPENHLRIIRVPNLDRLRGHVVRVTPLAARRRRAAQGQKSVHWPLPMLAARW
jgi:hypothetical protein